MSICGFEHLMAKMTAYSLCDFPSETTAVCAVPALPPVAPRPLLSAEPCAFGTPATWSQMQTSILQGVKEGLSGWCGPSPKQGTHCGPWTRSPTLRPHGE